MVDFNAAPWRPLAYAYRAWPAATVDLHGLPETMRAKLCWWLHQMHLGGERINTWVLLDRVKGGPCRDG